jgi:hypothetical protein
LKYLRASTVTTVVIGPFISKGDGFTPLAGLSAPAGRVVKNGTGSALTVTSWAHDANGHYTIDLATGDTDTVGRLRLDFSDPTTFLPVWEDFSVLSAAVYDVLFGTVAPSTYAGGDTAGTGTLLGRLTTGRATNLDNLDAPVLSRMATFTYTAPANATIAAIAADYQQRAVAVTLPTTPPAGYGGSLDAAALWGADLPGAYPAGSAGALLGLVPDVELLAATILQGVTELLTTGGGGGGGGVTGPVDLSAGAVAAVAGAILVTAANKLRSDAQGRVELAPGGLEQVPVGDAGGNARHALDAIYSAQAHAVQASPASGPGRVTIGPPGDPRIEADVDGLGNRSNVTVTRRGLP